MTETVEPNRNSAEETPLPLPATPPLHPVWEPGKVLLPADGELPGPEKELVAQEPDKFPSGEGGPPLHLSPLLASFREGLRGLRSDPQRRPEDKAALVYHILLSWTRQFYHVPACRSEVQLDLARELLSTCFQILGTVERPVSLFFAVRRVDAGLAGHCSNVAFLGLGYARFYGWPTTAARTFGLGALLHDLGMTAMQEAWEKSSPLDGQDMEALRRHPQAGVRLLAPFRHLSGKIFHMVAQHHENMDGSGYPLGLPASALHPYARLLRVLDSFEALTSVRPWRAPLPPAKALACMRYAAEQCEFDEKVLVNFQRFLSWPGPAAGA